jgi:hypothetical protein
MQVDLLVHPLGHRVPVQVVLEQRQRHDQRHQPLPLVIYEAQELLLVLAGDMVLQVAHQVLEDVDMLAPRAHHAQALHEHSSVLGGEFIPVPLAGIGDEATHLGVVLGAVGSSSSISVQR